MHLPTLYLFTNWARRVAVLQIDWNKQDVDSTRCAGVQETEAMEREKLNNFLQPVMPVAQAETCLGCRDP